MEFHPTGGNISGLAFDASGVLWVARGGQGQGNPNAEPPRPAFIQTVDPATGVLSPPLNLRDADGNPEFLIRVSDLAFGSDGTLDASLTQEGTLATIDTDTGELTRIGNFGVDVTRMSGLSIER